MKSCSIITTIILTLTSTRNRFKQVLQLLVELGQRIAVDLANQYQNQT